MPGFATFSITGGLAQDYIDRGEMIPFSGIIAVEGVETGDRRMIAPMALTWRDLPLPFMVQLENPVGGEGHDGAKLGGRLNDIERLPAPDLGPNVFKIKASGHIDPSITEDARTFALAMDRGIMRGVSVDLDQVKTVDMASKEGAHSQVITGGRVMGLTGTPFQAFAEATIEFDLDTMRGGDEAVTEVETVELPLVASGGAAPVEGDHARYWLPVDAIETLVASGAEGFPVAPPASWFEKPQLDGITPLTITPSGQVFGHIAAWGTCHISFAGRCVPVPRSSTNYSAFRKGTVVTHEGTSVRTGPIVMDTVHPDLRWQASDAQAFYADTGSAICDVVPYEDRYGLAVAGAVRPNVTPAQLRAFRASDISPDWRTIDGKPRECCAMLAVNNSGFKLPERLVASGGMVIQPGETAVAIDHDEVYALVASGPMSVEPCCDACAGHGEELAEDEELAAGDVTVIEAEQEAEHEEDVMEMSVEDRLANFRARYGPKPPRKFRAAAKPRVRRFRTGQVDEFGKFVPFEKGHGKKKNPKPKPFADSD